MKKYESVHIKLFNMLKTLINPPNLLSHCSKQELKEIIELGKGLETEYSGGSEDLDKEEE